MGDFAEVPVPGAECQVVPSAQRQVPVPCLVPVLTSRFILRRVLRVLFLIILLTLLTACAEPPSKEMNQAQGAIDAARAAGADRYASAELMAAVDALKRSEEAVSQRDYRLALSHAIDSRERAQHAAKTAGETRAKARGDAERHVAEVNTLLAQARQRLDDPASARLSPRELQNSRSAIDTAEKNMQEARAALSADDYPRAIKMTEGLAARLRAVLRALDRSGPAGPTRRRR